MTFVVNSRHIAIGEGAMERVNDRCEQDIHGIGSKDVVAAIKNVLGSIFTQRERLHLDITVHVWRLVHTPVLQVRLLRSERQSKLSVVRLGPFELHGTPALEGERLIIRKRA